MRGHGGPNGEYGDSIVCPFLDEADPRCAAHQSLAKLDEALTLCVDEYQACCAYRQKLLGHAPNPPKVAERLRVAG